MPKFKRLINHGSRRQREETEPNAFRRVVAALVALRFLLLLYKMHSQRDALVEAHSDRLAAPSHRRFFSSVNETQRVPESHFAESSDAHCAEHFSACEANGRARGETHSKCLHSIASSHKSVVPSRAERKRQKSGLTKKISLQY